MIDLTVDMKQYDCPFIDTTDDYHVAFSAIHWDFNPAARELETRMVVEGRDRGALNSGLRALRAHPNMHNYQLLAKRDATAHIQTVIQETDAMNTIRNHDGYITGPFHIESGRETWHVGFDQRDTMETTLSDLEQHNDFRVTSREQVDMTELREFVQNAGAATTLIEACRDLSEVEQQTLETAVSEGYFETPRDATLGTLADRFDVSKPAVSKTLRRSERKIVSSVVEALDTLQRQRE